MRIAMVAAEAFPYAKNGGLADVAGALPRALAAAGHRARVYFPRYRQVPGSAGLRREARELPVSAFGAERTVAFWAGEMGPDGAEAVAVDCPALYDRDGMYGPPGADFPDNAERFVVLCLAALEHLRVTGFAPDVLHAHDWHAGLLPVLARERYGGQAELSDAATVLTIHNIAYQGTFPPGVLEQAGLPRELFRSGGLDHFGQVSFLQAGIRFADAINTVSPRYANEVLESDEFGRGMQGVLRERMSDFFGILNGVDQDCWNPAADPHLPAAYDAGRPAGKEQAKAALLSELGLDADAAAPLFGVVSRLDPQKGLDLLVDAAGAIVAAGARLAVLGSGDPALEAAFRALALRHRGKVAVGNGHNEPLAHRIYAGSDFFLMPSRFEPCGLGQMIALRYGTIPVVRETGGLADTVSDADRHADGNGFTFQDASAEAVAGAAGRAIAAYRAADRRSALVRSAMKEDHSWKRSAARYEELYGWTVRSTRRARRKGRTA